MSTIGHFSPPSPQQQPAIPMSPAIGLDNFADANEQSAHIVQSQEDGDIIPGSTQVYWTKFRWKKIPQMQNYHTSHVQMMWIYYRVRRIIWTNLCWKFGQSKMALTQGKCDTCCITAIRAVQWTMRLWLWAYFNCFGLFRSIHIYEDANHRETTARQMPANIRSTTGGNISANIKRTPNLNRWIQMWIGLITTTLSAHLLNNICSAYHLVFWIIFHWGFK